MAEKKSNITVQYTRLTHADRVADRFLTSQVYTPADPESLREGIIFSQIEILNPWFPTSQIGQTIINTAIREYYRATDNSELNNFETALKKVNETLAQVTQSGETDWIGNLHGILMLINDNDIHISQTGQTQAYLFRGGKVNHITEGLVDNGEPHPMRTFSNIISGTLQAGDRIVIANPLFLKTIDLDLINETVSGNPPALAATEFAKLLKRSKANAGEAIIIEITTKNEAAELPLEYKNDTVYLDQGSVGMLWQGLSGSLSSRKKEPSGYSKTSSTFSKVRSSIGSTLRKADNAFDTHVRPHIQSIAKKSYNAVRQGTGKAVSKVTKGRTPNTPPAIAKAQTKIAPVAKKITSMFSFGDNLSQQGRTRRYGVWGAALIIVLIILILVSRIQPHSAGTANDSKIQNTVEELNAKFNKAKLLSAYNDKQVALQEMASIFSTLNDYSKEGDLPASLQNIKDQAIDELASLTETTRIKDGDTLAEWGNRPNIAGFGDSAYAINSFLLTKVPGNEDYTLSDTGEISSIALNREKQDIYLLGSGGLFMFDSATKKVSSVKLSAGNWPTDQTFNYFDDNLYFLDKAAGQVIKYVKQDNGYSEGNEYSEPSGDELKKSVDIAINGKVVVLLDNGNIVQYTSSGRVETNYSGLPADGFVRNPQRVFADLESTNIYVLHEDKWVDGLWRLTKLTRSGSYVSSYFLPDSASNWKSIDFNANSKNLWIVTQDAIYKTNID